MYVSSMIQSEILLCVWWVSYLSFLHFLISPIQNMVCWEYSSKIPKNL